MKHTFRKQHFSSLCNGSLLLVLGATLLFGACADDDLVNEQPGKHTGTTVAFNVSDAQMESLAQAGAKGITRGLSPQPLSSADLAPRKLEATGSNPHDFCLIESTVEGFNPVKPAEGTRAEIIKTATLGDFSSIGYRASQPNAPLVLGTSLLWFHNEKTDKDGNIVNHRYDWDWPVNVYARFYAVYPEATGTNGVTLSPSNSISIPYVDFKANLDVKQQVDLMTACSGVVHYIHGNDPTSNLEFHHSLAAIKFSIGSNLSPIRIKKIEIQNVRTEGCYQLPTKADGSDGQWRYVLNNFKTVYLDGIDLNAAEMPNTMLAGALEPATDPNNRNGREKYTFLLPPQRYADNPSSMPITAVIYYKEAGVDKTISFKLKGADWKAGVTKEYKLSQKNSSWGYHFTLTGNENDKTFSHDANYTGATNTQFQVTSYRQSGTTQQPVPWKISKYEEWDYTLNGGTGGWVDRGTTKPDWLGDITDHGNGGTAAEACNTAVKAASVTDQLGAYNKVLKDATPKGTAANPYNLANPGGNGSMMNIEESANCYLISAPGHYCLPLVYGNSYKNGMVNGNSFRSTQPAGTPYLLKTFKDHRDMDMAGARISAQLGTYLDGASIVWMDQPNLIRSSSLSVANNIPTNLGSMDFLEFEVKKEDIRNGNAVIAVKLGNTIVWSWHLWFDHADALDKIPVKNYDGTIYNFTRNTLGQVHIKYEVTSYNQPRKARLTIEQQASNGGIKASSSVVITQNPGNVREDASTFYQFGRKDALPGTDTFYPSNGYSFEADNNGNQGRTYGYAIQHPENMFISALRYGTGLPDTWCHEDYINAWSANNAETGNWSNDAIVKTIYDPCPAGFHVPASKAFTGFTTTGNGSASESQFNVEGTFNKGWNFKTNWGSSTIFFPAFGTGSARDGSINGRGEFGCYWSAFPAFDSMRSTQYGLLLNAHTLDLKTFFVAAGALSVRPVADN